MPAQRRNRKHPEMRLRSKPQEPIASFAALGKVPKCDRCGVVDSTLRASVFTYIVSGVLISIRKVAAEGVFCSKHRRIETVKWSLLTGLFGWWSLVGIITTPIILVRDLRGGQQNKELNARILEAAAEELVKSGDTPEAIRALETASSFHDLPEVTNRLHELRGY
jgi:hypothetical protein